MVRGSIVYNFEFACWGDVNAFYRLWLLSCYFVGQQTILELERRKLFLHRYGKLSPNTCHTIGSARRTRTVRRRLHPLSAQIIRCLAQRSNKCKPLYSPLNDSSHWWTGTGLINIADALYSHSTVNVDRGNIVHTQPQQKMRLRLISRQAQWSAVNAKVLCHLLAPRRPKISINIKKNVIIEIPKINARLYVPLFLFNRPGQN